MPKLPLSGCLLRLPYDEKWGKKICLDNDNIKSESMTAELEGRI